MTDLPATHNQFAYSITELSGAIKRAMEDGFGHVRVRGEISGWRPAASGHAYFKLKDEGAALDAVCWKGIVGKMAFRPEDGMEVIATGRVTTYPGRSTYQIVVDYMEPAGAGALMAMLEKCKAMLAAEGLFDAGRKKPLPFMPRVIGVVTSPTGAVIKDILHRLSERFPCHVLVWPVLVQGEQAAAQIAGAIQGFNALLDRKPDLLSASLPAPDLLIVARGGGSLEDLWPFNEEIVVRAASSSRIPLISAVGHETDTTLIDYASDHRAPTPTAAAERAVPVREEWLSGVLEQEKRLIAAKTRFLRSLYERLEGFARGLVHPQRHVDMAAQRLDDWSERLDTALVASLARRTEKLSVAGALLQPPRHRLEMALREWRGWSDRLAASLPQMLGTKRQALELAAARLQPQGVLRQIERQEAQLPVYGERLVRLWKRNLGERTVRIRALEQLLESLSPKRIMERGFVLVTDASGALVTQAASARPGDALTLSFADGTRRVRAE